MATTETLPDLPETVAPIDPREWRWYGNAAHFICGRWCRFHMATVIGDLLVSTVGQYLPTSDLQTMLADLRGEPLTQRGEAREFEFIEKFGYEPLGAWGTFETMVFVAGKPCDAEGCGCGLPTINGRELDGERYASAKDATEGHMRYCEKAARHLIPRERE